MILKIVEEKKRRYDELHNLMADPDVIANKADTFKGLSYDEFINQKINN